MIQVPHALLGPAVELRKSSLAIAQADPLTLRAAKGTKCANEVAVTSIPQLFETPWSPYLLQDTPAAISMGRLTHDHGSTAVWVNTKSTGS